MCVSVWYTLQASAFLGFAFRCPNVFPVILLVLPFCRFHLQSFEPFLLLLWFPFGFKYLQAFLDLLYVVFICFC